MSLSVSLAMALLAALLLDALLGEPDWLWRRLPHPAVLLGRAVGALEKRLNQGSQRRAKGVLALLVLMGGAGALGWGLSYLGAVAEILIAAVLLAQRSLCDHVAAVQTGLRQNLEQGRFAVSMIVSRNTAEMSEGDVTRAAIESGAENLSDGVIAPALWFLLGGVPGILIYKAVNTADSMIGYRNERYEQFGWASARMDDLLNLIPARLTALLLALSGGQLRAWREIARDARRHRSPNAGWPEAALSRGLDLALAGPRVYDGQRQELAWVNPKGSHQAQASDIARAVRKLWHSWGLFVLVILALTIAQMMV